MRIFFFFLIATFILSQINAPLIAGKIKKRFRELGYMMSSSMFMTFFNDRRFWKEAIFANKKYQDPFISRQIFYYRVWFYTPMVMFVILIGVAAYHLFVKSLTL